jgi:hypothetical protein
LVGLRHTLAQVRGAKKRRHGLKATIVSPVLDSLGCGQRRELVPGGWHPEVRTRSWQTPASELRTRQPARVPINVAHRRDLEVGEVVHLQRDKSGRCWVVGVFDGGAEKLLTMPTSFRQAASARSG